MPVVYLHRGWVATLRRPDHGQRRSGETIGSVTQVNVDMGAVNSGFLTWDLGGGQFAPDGNPTAEIKFLVSNLGAGVRVGVEGTNGPDGFTVGIDTS